MYGCRHKNEHRYAVAVRRQELVRFSSGAKTSSSTIGINRPRQIIVTMVTSVWPVLRPTASIAPSEGGELNQIRAVDDGFALLAFLHTVCFLDLNRRKTCGSSADEQSKKH